MTTIDAKDFTNGPLYKALVAMFPLYVQNPFGDSPTLNVERLRNALPEKKSHEAVYKWLRASKLTPENADHLVTLANSPENVKALSSLDRKPPTREDFLKFVFSA